MFGYLMALVFLFGGDPPSPEQLYRQGLAAESQRQHKAALTHYTRAIGAVTESEDLIYAAYRRELESSQAKKQYARALAIEPNRPGVVEKHEVLRKRQAGHFTIQNEGNFPIEGLIHLGIDKHVITLSMMRYDLVCGNPAVEILALLDAAR